MFWRDFLAWDAVSTAAYAYGTAGLFERYDYTLHGAFTGTDYTAYAFDPAGSVTQRLVGSDPNAAYTDCVAGAEVFDAYGQRQIAVAAGAGTGYAQPDPVGFGGQFGCYTDLETGLVLMTYRYYDAKTCRFLTRDPAGYAAGVNPYAYCGGNPVMAVDPLGLWELDLGGGPYFVFTADGVGQGLKTGVAAVGSAASFGLWDGGAYKNQPGFGAAKFVGSIGVMAASGAAGLAGGTASMGSGLSECVGPEAAGSGEVGFVNPGEGAGTAMEPAADEVLVTEGPGPAVEEEVGAGCFVAGTPVQTPAGPRAIERIRKGDRVWSRNPKTGKTEVKAVVRTFIHRKPAVVTLGFAKTARGLVVDQVTCTPNHPFWVKGKGFVQAGELGIGTQIVTRAGPALFLVSAKRRNEPAGVLVYNFEVEGNHTYFVGTAGGGLWVHNSCPPLQPDPDAAGPHTTFRRDPATGQITHYETWEPNSYTGGYRPLNRFDGEGSGIGHYSKTLGRYVPEPHMHIPFPDIPGGPLSDVRPCLPGELPLGY